MINILEGKFDLNAPLVKSVSILLLWAVLIGGVGWFHTSIAALISVLLLTVVLAFFFYQSLREISYIQQQFSTMLITGIALFCLLFWMDENASLGWYFLVVASSSFSLLLPCIISTKKRNLTDHVKVFTSIYGVISITVSLYIGTTA